MLKNRKVVGLLLFLAAAIWGVIIYRIVVMTGNNDVIPVTQSTARVVSEFTKDSLILDYRDPFLGEFPKKVVKNEVPKNIVPRQNIVQDFPPQFRYTGKIKKGRTDFVLIERNGETQDYRMNDVVDGFRIKRIYADSLVVTKKGKDYTLYL